MRDALIIKIKLHRITMYTCVYIYMSMCYTVLLPTERFREESKGSCSNVSSSFPRVEDHDEPLVARDSICTISLYIYMTCILHICYTIIQYILLCVCLIYNTAHQYSLCPISIYVHVSGIRELRGELHGQLAVHVGSASRADAEGVGGLEAALRGPARGELRAKT